jgi:hypothetical protein
VTAERVCVCETCGDEFVSTRSDAHHCTSACKQRAYRLRLTRRTVSPSEIDDAIAMTAYPEDAILVVVTRLQASVAG